MVMDGDGMDLWRVKDDTQSLGINGSFACRVFGILGGLEFYFVASLECSCKQLVLMQGLSPVCFVRSRSALCK